MSGAVLTLLQNAFMAWCSVKEQGELYLYLLLLCMFSLLYPNILLSTVLKHHPNMEVRCEHSHRADKVRSSSLGAGHGDKESLTIKRS
jgi:hypothetical protein